MRKQPAPKPPSATPAEAPKQEPTPPPAITKEMIRDAVAVAGLKFDDAQIEMMSQGLNDRLRTYKTIWDLKIPNDVAPALVFDPVVPGMTLEHKKRPLRLSRIAAPGTPKNIEDVAFYSVRQRGQLLRTKKISSGALAY